MVNHQRHRVATTTTTSPKGRGKKKKKNSLVAYKFALKGGEGRR